MVGPVPPATSTRRSARAAALPPDERRSAIVAATIPLVAAHGDAVTTRQIADAAGIAEGTIFRVFNDKDAVIAAVLDSVLDPAPLDEAIAAIDATLPLEQRLLAAVSLLADRTLKVWGIVSGIGPRHQEHARQPLADSGALVALLRPDARRLRLDPLLAARTLRAMALALTHPLLTPEPFEPDEIVATFLHGALATDDRGDRC